WVKRMGDYETIWKKWSSVFPREQLLVIFNEEISNNPEEVMSRICSFIGVEKQFDKSYLSIQPNKSEEMEIPVELKKYLDQIYIPVIKRMPEWLGMENKFWKV
ncbi:MAG TPA: sulfotransferase domain-containing protein, partial [Bacteroidia bacterium]|nr:sulfotransferase domain-containing protein [Bacteroidia bacterium]